MKLREGLHESGDEHLHVSGRHFELYETKNGDFKLVPKRNRPLGPGRSKPGPSGRGPKRPRGVLAPSRG